MDDKVLVTKALLPEYEEYCEIIKPLWESHWLTNMGKLHIQLEQELKAYLGVNDISLFNNGHMALELTLQALGLQGEVITTPFTFVSTAHAIARNGLSPVFCDIEEDTFTINTNQIESLITDKTCALVPVHVYGNICNVEKIQKIADKYRLKVIYDAAHAFGVKYKGSSIGNFGEASMFSFHATKVFNTIEGGAVTFHNEQLREKLYQLKNFGIKSEVAIQAIGSNAKMNEFQAAMGLCNLKILDAAIQKRKAIMERYCKNLQTCPGLKLPQDQAYTEKNYAYMPIIISREEYGHTRDYLYDKLKEKNIYARKYFYPLISSLDCYRDIQRLPAEGLPVAEKISEGVLTLPIEPNMTLDLVDKICDIILSI